MPIHLEKIGLLYILAAASFVAAGAGRDALAGDAQTRPAPAISSIFDFGHDDPPAYPQDVPRPFPPALRRADPARDSALVVPAATPSSRPAVGLDAKTAAAPVLGKTGRAFVEKALDAADRNSNSFLKMLALFQIVKFHLYIGDTAGARTAYQRLAPLLADPELRTRGTYPISFDTYIIIQGDCGDIEAAKRTAAAAAAAGENAGHAQRLVAVEQAKLGKVDEALATALAIPDRFNSERRAAFQGVAVGGLESGGRTRMEQAYGAISNPALREEALACLAGAEARRGDPLAALELVETVRDPRLKSTAMTWIAQFQAFAGAPRGAVARANALPDARQRSSAMQAVALELLREGNAIAARDAAITVTSPGAAAYTLFRIANVQAENGDVVEARKTLDLCPQGYERAVTLAKIQAAAGQVKEAFATAESIPRGDKDKTRSTHEEALLGIVRAQLRKGDITGAKETAGMISLPGVGWNVRHNAFLAIAEAQAAYHDYGGARATALASATEKSTLAGITMAHVAAQQAADGDIAGAKQTLDLIPSPLPNDRALGARLVASIAVAAHPDTAPAVIAGWAPSFGHPFIESWLFLGAAEGTLHIRWDKTLNIGDGLPSW